MTNSITNIAPDNVPQLSYRGKPVVTTSVLAALYGTEAKYIQNNYKRNETRFEEGKHYFKVTGNELKELKKQPSLRGLVSKMVSHLLLYTERGAARHAKMLETDAAWDVFEALEDNYFGPMVEMTTPPEPQQALPNPLTPDHQRGIQKAVARRAQALPKGLQRLAYSRLYSHLKDRFDVAKYDQIPDEQYTQALAAIETCELDGEWLPAPEDNPAHLSIHYPMSRWAEINHGLAFDWKNQVPQGYKGREVWFVRPGRLCGDLTDHGSPTLLLLRELVDAGYNVEACQAEINAMRSTISELDSLQQRVLHVVKCGNAYPLIVQH